MINCCLPDARVSFPFGCTAAMAGRYSGIAVEILTVGGAILRLTAGHLLPVGFDRTVRADAVCAGDQLFRVAVKAYEESAASLFAAAQENEDFLHVRALVKPHYFHGEGALMRGQVAMTVLDPGQKFVNLENTMARKPVGSHRFIRHMLTDVVSSVRSFPYEGPVYDFSGDSLTFYAVSGVIVHNCRCHLEWRPFLQ